MALTKRMLEIPDLPDGGLRIPVVEMVGRGDGPHLTIIAGIHGCEYTSMAAVRRFITEASGLSMNGRITAVPVVNLPAFTSRTPFVVPQDQKNLNRSFPGAVDGSYTDRLAYHVFEQIFRGSDYLVDLHAGDLPESLEPVTIYDETDDADVSARARELAKVYGVGHVLRQPRAERTVAGSTSAACADAGIPAIIAEAGGNGLLTESAVQTHLTGLRNVTRHLKMLDGEPTPSTPPVEHSGWHWLRSPVGGWWEPTVTAGSTVRAGQALGDVTDLVGEPRHSVTAPNDGTLLFVTSSPAISADGLLLGIALEDGE